MASPTLGRICLRNIAVTTRASHSNSYASTFLSTYKYRMRCLSTCTPSASLHTLHLRHIPPFRTHQIPSKSAAHAFHSSTSKNAETASAAPSTPTDAPLPRILQNPRTDPTTNNPMIIRISPRATQRLSQIIQRDSNPDVCLRVSLESGGCHGFQYLMELTDMTEVSAEEDTVFEGEQGAKVVVDEASLEVLNGSKVDYTMELIGSQFKIVDIPGASSSCGCGTSFDIKI